MHIIGHVLTSDLKFNCALEISMVVFL